MVVRQKQTAIAIAVILIVGMLFSGTGTTRVTKAEVARLTDTWIREVTVNHDPIAIARMFCQDGSLVGTVSQVKRTGTDIRRYFDYFAKLPDIRVISKQYNISEVTPHVYLNTAFITWSWRGVGRCGPYLFFSEQMHFPTSSSLPELNQELLNVSDPSLAVVP